MYVYVCVYVYTNTHRDRELRIGAKSPAQDIRKGDMNANGKFATARYMLHCLLLAIFLCVLLLHFPNKRKPIKEKGWNIFSVTYPLVALGSVQLEAIFVLRVESGAN